jgi:preprotein translocase subunit YajC
MAAPPGGQPVNPLVQLIPFVLIFAIFYLLVIAPARKKAKTHAKMLEALKAGDRVVTSGGIYGTVVGVDDVTVHLRVADQVKIEVAKQAVTEVRRPE